MEPQGCVFCFKYGVPKNTISTWKTNKSKSFEAFNNGSCIKKQRMKPETYEALNKSLPVDREEINVKQQSLLTDFFEKKKD